jgi:anti-sigma factor RsiW
MTSCADIQESLGAWLDGELSPADTDVVRAHLISCSDCNQELRQLEKLNASMQMALASQATAIPFDPFWRGVRRRIVEKRPRYVDWIEWGRELFSGSALAWSIPAVIGLFLISYSFGVWKDETPRNNFATVESIDAYGRNVALLRENETRTTVIWLYQNQEGDNESAGETSDKTPTF